MAIQQFSANHHAYGKSGEVLLSMKHFWINAKKIFLSILLFL